MNFKDEECAIKLLILFVEDCGWFYLEETQTCAQPKSGKNLNTLVFNVVTDSGGQAGVDVLSVDVKPSVELMARLLALPVQVLQQLS